MRAMLAVVLLALAACVPLPEWGAADTDAIQAAKSQCAAATREALPEPSCAPASYTFLHGEAMLRFRADRQGRPRCSYLEMNTYAGYWGASYRQCLAKAGVTS